MKQSLHPESLLRIPLINQMHSDSQVAKRARAVDLTWKYQKLIPMAGAGFNPFSQAIYYGQISCFADWIANPAGSVRAINEGDYALHEVLMATHDYLHAWAYLAIHELAPDLGFPEAPITEKNFEDYLFCHLLTEAVATVGVDYWFLSGVDLNKYCEIGTALRNLTVNYREEQLYEFKKFNPSFNPCDKGFFLEVARFYCTGILEGFDERALTESPLVSNWMQDELVYGEKQREYARLWFSYLAKDGASWSRRRPSAQLSMPVSMDDPWKIRLARVLGERLWDKIKNGKQEKVHRVFDPALCPSPDLDRPFDFRFLNANSPEVRRRLSTRKITREQLPFLFYQRVSNLRFQRSPAELRKAISKWRAPKAPPVSIARASKLKPALEPVQIFLMG